MLNLKRKIIFLAFLVLFAYLYHYKREGPDSNLLRIESVKAKDIKEGPCPTLPVIRFTKVGRLGNQLSSYVNMLVLERSFMVAAYMPANIRKHIQAFFTNVTMPVFESISHCDIQFVKITSFSQFSNTNSECYSKTKKRIDLCFPPNISTQGEGLWTERGHTGPRFELIKHHMDWLFQNHLKLNINLQKNADDVLSKYRSADYSIVGVHVRRTDYEKLLGGKYPHNPLFYKEAVNLLRKQRGEMEVVVLSDDMEWCRQNIQIPGAHFIGSQSFLLDLAILSSCDHSVIDYGTFGVWGAFLSRGDAILPQSATIKYKQFPKLLNWTVMEGY